MAKMTKGTSGAKTAGASKQYLQLGGKTIPTYLDSTKVTTTGGKELSKREQKRNQKFNEKMMKKGPVPSKKEEKDTSRTTPGGGAVMPLRKKQLGGSATKANTSKLREYLKDYSSDPSLPPGFKKMKPSKTKVNPNDIPYKKKGGMVKKQLGGSTDIDFKRASEMFKPKSKTYNSEDIKKTLPGVKSESPSGKPKGASSKGSPYNPMYKQKGGMTKSKKK